MFRNKNDSSENPILGRDTVYALYNVTFILSLLNTGPVYRRYRLDFGHKCKYRRPRTEQCFAISSNNVDWQTIQTCFLWCFFAYHLWTLRDANQNGEISGNIAAFRVMIYDKTTVKCEDAAVRILISAHATDHGKSSTLRVSHVLWPLSVNIPPRIRFSVLY